MGPIRIGCVSYLNTVPLIEGLDRVEGLELVRAAPAMLAGMLERGEVDIALASLVDAARSRVGLSLLPAGMIGCDGPTFTVRLFSRVPFERVTRVHADTESHTSVVLCRVVLKKKFGVEASVVDFNAREGVEVGAGAPARGGQAPRARSDEPRAGAGAPETLLLIGDKVVTCAPEHALYPHELDLGGAWKELTVLRAADLPARAPAVRGRGARTPGRGALSQRGRRDGSDREDRDHVGGDGRRGRGFA